ncbi:hypothetical protein [Streptomyces amritsarensis]|uniref:hypothetical protein n=1 Tax=Streptomyces amritsarensis TaxID=681158 RepID=UPI0036B2FBE9
MYLRSYGGFGAVRDLPERRSWNADRFFPHFPGTAELTRVLTADETRTWLARTS